MTKKFFQPRIFDAHLCRGRCPPRFNMANDHAMLQSIMHLQTRHQIHGKIPKPCCVGRKFRPLDILHVDDLDPTKLKVTRWKDVIVTECFIHACYSVTVVDSLPCKPSPALPSLLPALAQHEDMIV